jgi:hypothetical protein
MKKVSKQNNPEQKTGTDLELGSAYHPIDEAKHNYRQKGQPVKSKQRIEQT